MYHFLSGYTAKVVGTEIGVTEPDATFSTCFGAPFMPRHPSVYGNLLKERIAEGEAECWLLNTGWTGGMATMPGSNACRSRPPRAAQRGARRQPQQRRLPQDLNFGFDVPVAVPGVDRRDARSALDLGPTPGRIRPCNRRTSWSQLFARQLRASSRPTRSDGNT